MKPENYERVREIMEKLGSLKNIRKAIEMDLKFFHSTKKEKTEYTIFNDQMRRSVPIILTANSGTPRELLGIKFRGEFLALIEKEIGDLRYELETL